MKRRIVILVVAPLLALLGAGAAWAFWTATGSGTASASTGTINAPTAVAASTTAGSGTVNVSWTASAPSASGAIPSGYYVTRVRNSDSVAANACGTSPSLPTHSSSCADSVEDGTYHYVVTAVMATWTAASSSSNNVLSDTTRPSVTINQATGQADPTNNATVNFTVNFSESVTGFAGDDVAITGTATGTKSASVTGSGAGPYALTVTGATGAGTIIADIAAGKAQDLAGNTNTSSTSSDNSVTIDTTIPTVVGVSSTLADGVYKATQTIPVTVAFSEPVTVTGFPLLTLTTGSSATTPVGYSSGSGTSVLTFNYTVAQGDTSADLDYAATTSLALNGGTIGDAVNNATLTLSAPGALGSLGLSKNIVVDAIAPTVVGVSSTLADGVYKAPQSIPVTVTFSEPVTVTGSPKLTLNTSSPPTTAVSYASGSGTNVLTFSYTVAAGNASADLDYAGTSALLLNSGFIRDSASNDATLTLAAPGTANSLGANKALVIDAVPPSVNSIGLTGASATVKSGPLSWTVTFSEPVNGVAPANFALASSNLSGTPPTITSATPSGGAPSSTWTVLTSETGATGTNAGSIGLNLTGVGSIVDVATNALSATTPVVGAAYVFDTTLPTVSSIVRTGAFQTVKAGPLSWTVTFSEPVNNVAASNFALAVSGTTGTAPTIASATASGATPNASWTVSTNLTGTTGTNTGSIGLNLANTGSIVDRATNALSATVPLVGPAYTFDSTPPQLTTATSGGGTTLGKMEVNDTLVLTFDEPLAAGSVPTSVTVTEARAGTSTLTIPGLIQAAAIDNNYLGGNNSSGSASATVVLSNGNKTVTITLGTVSTTGGGVIAKSADSAANVTIKPGSGQTDVAGNGALATSSALLSRLF
jgi:hypothetical protein